MRYIMGFALLVAMSAASYGDAVRDAGSKVRGDWMNIPAVVAQNQAIYRAYSVAPQATAPVVVAPAPVAAAPVAPAPSLQAQANRGVRSFVSTFGG